ncbi:unnamed protein product [Blepharisma stoltei]|uniref:Protein kinase domain-containing protein n=1 Tax=Blepharisma stoltei TaxID=1481888 RepID=A0AAU9JI64_9CILI|nr:unnamed protein product [Blepharisma stoltei]
MDRHDEILSLIHIGLAQKLKAEVENPSGALKKLLDEILTLSLAQFQELKDTINQSTPEQHQKNANDLLTACICNAALETEPFTTDLARQVMPLINYLKERPDFNPESTYNSLLSNIISGISACKTVEDVDEWVTIIDILRNEYNFTDVETELKWAESKYIEFVWEGMKNDDPVQLARQLVISKRLEGKGFDMSFAKNIAIDFSYDYIEEKDEAGQPDGISELLNVLLGFEINDEDKSAKINLWKVKYGVKPEETKTETIPQPPRNLDMVISASSQIELINPPFYSHSPTENLIVSVYRGICYLPNRIDIAVKTYTIAPSSDEAKFNERLTNINKEIELLRDLSGKHPSFLEYYGSYHEKVNDQHVIGIAMEYCTQTLMHEITNRGGADQKYTERELYDKVVFLLEGFSFLEQKKILHQDIKPHNIFINREGILKIADFNIAQKYDEGTTYLATGVHFVQGTQGYMAPELRKLLSDGRLSGAQGPIRGKFKPAKADIYSLGLTFLQMYTLRSVETFSTPEGREELEKILKNIEFLWLKTILDKMLSVDKEFRPKFKHLLSKIKDTDEDSQTIMV